MLAIVILACIRAPLRQRDLDKFFHNMLCSMLLSISVFVKVTCAFFILRQVEIHRAVSGHFLYAYWQVVRAAGDHQAVSRSKLDIKKAPERFLDLPLRGLNRTFCV